MRHFTRESCFGRPWLAAAAQRKPLGTIKLGEPVTVETSCSWNCDLRPDLPVEQTPKRGETCHNPVTGPFVIEGVRAGDWIAVHIEDIQVARYGYARRGGPFVNRSRRVIEVRDGRVHFPGGVSVPARPMIGVIGVIPEEDSTDPGAHGGNLDIPEMRAGAIFHVRAQREGGLFVMGDCHAVQGEGEITGTGVEIDAVSCLHFERSPNLPCQNPVLETATDWQTIGFNLQWADAVRSAFFEMIELVRQQYGLSDDEANLLVGTVADVKNCCIAGIYDLAAGRGPGMAIVRVSLPKDVLKARA